ncbi:hypothetical protein CH373_14420 [Leptospira perolatii]|uniref:HTH tetR-type domain-containing protein n=1 Tax=Leptospira perolatii TaxID=2023191 RepID=A0A2M9ZJY3_9LEPT|nr:TetR/AcrR family transcriptional regulator [Leptospira perolatii]PJZ69268.1 hypothetical protein CH360_12200 [Leptospira perolatii]PJZ72350.1 hypothetical protein CH373_14420 [Leptospira perolatii]
MAVPKIVDHEKVKEELLRPCLRLFAEKGYAAVTMREISRELCVSTGTLYHYFPTKEFLFEEVARFVVQEDVRELREFQAEMRNTNSLEQLKSLFEFAENREEHFRDMILLACDVYRHDSLKDESRILEECSKIYRESIRAHLGIGSKDLENMFFGILIGTVFQRMLETRIVDFRSTFHILHSLWPLMTNINLFEPSSKAEN